MADFPGLSLALLGSILENFNFRVSRVTLLSSNLQLTIYLDANETVKSRKGKSMFLQQALGNPLTATQRLNY